MSTAERLRRARGRRRRSPRAEGWHRRVFLAALALVACALALAVVRMAQATREGLRGKQALLAVEEAVDRRDLDRARAQLEVAHAAFQGMSRAIAGGGPALSVARHTPFARVQVRGAEAFAVAGLLVSDAGLRLVEASRTLVAPADARVPFSEAVNNLKSVRPSLASGVEALEAADANVKALEGYRLLAPLSGARSQLTSNLERIRARAVAAIEGLDAVIAFAGGGGPRRYLLFSQNPDEVRPTGGFMGTYGVLAADGQRLHLERYASTTDWDVNHPGAAIARDEAGSPFRFYDASIAPRGQTLADANTVPDWPTVARTAMRIWDRGGEDPVDGVLAVTPGFLARVLGALGPVEVPEYRERVTAANLRERFDFYTREDEGDTSAGRAKKDFIAELAKGVLGKMLEAPASRWPDLAGAVGASFAAREAMAWTRDDAVRVALSRRGWDGTLPEVWGDFLYDAEFEHQAKNGGSLRRVFDHRVEIREDGSARVTTILTVNNPEPARPFNPHSLAYHTLYGPQGATLDPASDPPAAMEPAIRGHPAAGWFRAAPPEGQTTLKVVWSVPALAVRLDDGAWAYGLWVMRLPDHGGDRVKLRVDLPDGWRWKDDPPPDDIDLKQDLIGVWRYGR